jgi:hypothetical protein
MTSAPAHPRALDLYQFTLTERLLDLLGKQTKVVYR